MTKSDVSCWSKMAGLKYAPSLNGGWGNNDIYSSSALLLLGFTIFWLIMAEIQYDTSTNQHRLNQTSHSVV